MSQPTIERRKHGLIVRAPFNGDFNEAMWALPRDQRRFSYALNAWIVASDQLDHVIQLMQGFFGGCVLLGEGDTPDEVIDAHGGRSVQERLSL